MITSQNLKQLAKADIRAAMLRIFMTSLLVFVIAVVFSLLISNLSGYNRYITNVMNIFEEVEQEQPEMLEAPTEEFIIELTDEINDAVPTVSGGAVVLIILILIMDGFISAGFEGYCLKVVRRQEFRAKDIMMSFEHFGKVLIMLIIRALTTVIGSMFFVLPGLIAYYSFSQCFMVMYDNPEYSAFQCLWESAKIMRGRKTMFFVLQMSFILWHFVSSLITQIVGVALLMIYIEPYIGLSNAHFYNVLTHPEFYTVQPQQPQQPQQ